MSGMSLAGLVFSFAALPCALVAGCWRLSLRMHRALVLAFGALAITGSAIFLTLDAQDQYLLGVFLWLVLIGAVVYTTCWGWKQSRKVAAAEGTG